MAKSKKKAPPKKKAVKKKPKAASASMSPDDLRRKLLLKSTLKPAKAVGKKKQAKGAKMNDIAVRVGLVNEGAAVPSTVSARIRRRLRKLIAEKLVVKDGEKATTTYRLA